MKVKQVLAIIDSEPEMPFRSCRDVMALIVLWAISIIHPIRVHRSIVKATKASIRKRIVAAAESEN